MASRRTADDFGEHLAPLFGTSHALLPFAHLITSNLSGADIGLKMLDQDFLRPDDRLVVMPLANDTWFAHGTLTPEDMGFLGKEVTARRAGERKLAIRTFPADSRRFDEEFGRLLRMAAPYDCEVTRFLRVVKTSMSVDEFGGRLLRDRILLDNDRFFVMELSERPWFAHNARSVSDCERL